MTSILVTSGAGYIGSHTCKALAASGFQPIAFDNLFRGNRWAVRYEPLAEGDIRDAEAVRAAIRKHRMKPSSILPALAYVSESVQVPDCYFSNLSP